MKGKEFAQRLTDLSDVLTDVGAHDQADAWRSMVPIFEAAPTTSVSAICDALVRVRVLAAEDGTRLEAMIAIIPALKRFLGGASAKKAVVEDLDCLASALAPLSELPTAHFARAAVEHLRNEFSPRGGRSAPVRDEVVRGYLQRLEEAISDDALFTRVFQELKSDAAVGTGEAKRLSKLFAKETARSKRAALDFIWGRHAALMGAHARQRANTGRTAA